MNKIAERLRELRIAHNMKQSELAKQLSVDYRTISNWECGVHEPSLDMVIKLSQIFNETTDYLLGVNI